ncbi:unnamed protein product [Penicillium pancosmium]
MSFSRISFDGCMEEQNSYSDASSSTLRTAISADQIVSGTITDGLQSDFFEDADHNLEDVELMESQQIPQDPGEENWEHFSEMQKISQPDISNDPILQSFSQNLPGNEQFKESTSILTKGLPDIPSLKDFKHPGRIKPKLLDEIYLPGGQRAVVDTNMAVVSHWLIIGSKRRSQESESIETSKTRHIPIGRQALRHARVNSK